MSRPAGLRKFVGPPSPAPARSAPSPGAPGASGPPANAPAAALAQAAPGQAVPGPIQAARAAAQGTAAAPQDEAAEHCEFCSTGIPSEHGHVADLEQSSLVCACRACYLLFTRDVLAPGDDPPQPPPGRGPEGAIAAGAAPRRGTARYRSVPDRYLRDSSRPMLAADWDELQIPVGLAFFLNSLERGTAGFYPSPAGATECTLDLAAWERLAASHPLLGVAEADVEAVLLHRDGSAAEAEYFIVPIDVCYELAGRMRMLWKGFDGGTEARASIAEFLDGVRKRARESPVRGDPAPAGPTSPASERDPAHG